MRIGEIILGPRSSIGFGNVFRDVTELNLENDCTIRNFNWISTSPLLVKSGGKGSLKLGEKSSITSRHYLDCSGGITIGEYTTIAGVRSTMITHQIDRVKSKQTSQGINIGKYCLISSNVLVCPGVSICDYSVVGMGTTLAGNYKDSNTLILGTKGKVKKNNLSGEYFGRLDRSVGQE